MAKLKITKVDGNVSEHDISPFIEYAFEIYAKKGFHRAFREDEKATDVYYLSWECLKAAGETVPMFGAEFIKTLKKVEVLDDDPLS
jgi:hypothetical protein